MPDGPKYYQKIYSNLVEYYGKGSLPDEKTFYQKLSNSDYRKGVFSNLVEAYGQDALPSYNDFEKRIEAPTPIDVSPRPAKRTEGLPTFAEQQASLAQYKNPYERAIDRDKASWSAALKTAYNGLVPGGIERLLGGIIEIAPSPFTLPKELVKLQKAQAKEDIKGVFDVARMEVTPEEQQALAFDIKNKGVADNAKALLGMSGQVIGDIILGAATAGTSFFLQAYNDGVNDYDESAKRAGIVPNDASRAMFGAVSGTINGLLEKFALDKIFGAGPALKNLQRKALVETFDEVLKSGKGLTIEALEKVAEKKVRNLAASARTKGLKTLYASTVEGGTEGLQSALTDIARNVTNEVEGRKVFDNAGLKQSIDNFINNTAAGFFLGAPMGAVSAFNTNVDNQLLKDIAKAQTPEQFQNITNDLTQTFEKANIPQEQRDAIINKMAEYVDVKNTIPAYTPAEVQQKVIPIILQRRAVDAAINEKQAAIEKLDESLKDDVQVEIDMLRDRRSYMNDQIRESVSEDKFSYFEENGKFFKRLGENKPEEISKNYFEMAFVGEKQQADKPAPTDKNITPFIVVDGETYTGKDHGEAMEKAREAGESVPDPATEDGKVWREENGLFKDSFGQTLTRDEAQQEYGVRNSSDIIKEKPEEIEIPTYTREQAKKILDQIDVPVDKKGIAMWALSMGNKVNYQSFKKETGGKSEAYATGFTATNKEKAPSVTKLAEQLWLEYVPEDMQATLTSEDIRSSLIDLMLTYKNKSQITQDFIRMYSPEVATQEAEAKMAQADEVVFLDDIAYSKNQYDAFLKDIGEIEESIRVSDEYVNILIQENEQDAQREGEQVAPEAEGKPAEPVVSPISVEEAGKAVGEYVRRFGTDEEIPAFDEYLKTETAREGFDAEYRENRRAEESKEEYVYRKYCK